MQTSRLMSLMIESIRYMKATFFWLLRKGHMSEADAQSYLQRKRLNVKI